MTRKIIAFMLLLSLTAAAAGCTATVSTPGSLPPQEAKTFFAQTFSSAGDGDDRIPETIAERETMATPERVEPENAEPEIPTEKTDVSMPNAPDSSHDTATDEAKTSESAVESDVPETANAFETAEADKPAETQKPQGLPPVSETANPSVTEEPPEPANPPKAEPPVTTEPPKPTEPLVTEEPPAPEEPEPPKEPTQADFDRIIAEVRAYAESYRDKGFTFEWNDAMEFGWEVGWFGAPSVKYDGVDGVIEILKLHVDRIYKAATDSKKGVPSSVMPYKVVQIDADGEIAFAVIYGG